MLSSCHSRKSPAAIACSSATTVVFFGLLWASSAPPAGAADPGAGVGVLEDVVLDRATRLPIPAASVRLETGEAAGVTTDDGRFRLLGISAGPHAVDVEAAGYAPALGLRVHVGPGATASLTAELEPLWSSPEEAEGPARQPRVWLPFGLGLGLAAERRLPSDPHASNTWGVGFLPRFIGRGLGPALSFSGFEASVVGPGAGATELGTLKVQPVMAGVEWQQPLGKRTTAQIHIVGGYSFNSTGKPGKQPRDATIVLPEAVHEVGDSFAWEARLALWRDLTPRLGVVVGARYLHTRPKLTLADGLERAWNADRVTIEAGVAFTVIKAPWAR